MVMSKERVTKFMTKASNEISIMCRLRLILFCILLRLFPYFRAYGACRREELANTAVSDEDVGDSVITVTIPKTKTCNWRVLLTVEVKVTTALELYRKLCQRNVPHRSFFCSLERMHEQYSL